MKPPFLLNKVSLVFTPSFPKDWNGAVLPGARLLSYSGNEGSILVQELKTEHYLLRFSIRLFQKAVLKSKSEKGLHSFLALKGSWTQKINGLPSFELTKGQFMLVNDPGSEVHSTLPGGRECQLCSCILPGMDGIVSRNIIPSVKEKKAFLSHSLSVSGTHQYPGCHTRAVFESYEAQLQEAFHGLKIKNSLFTILAQSNTEPGSKPPTPAQKEIVKRVHELILGNIAMHHSNTKLAEMAGINKTDLKRLFQQQYGVGMFELLQQERFEKARELLLKGDLNVKLIAPLVGYSHTTTFVTEFRKYFGYTPLDLQTGRTRRE